MPMDVDRTNQLYAGYSNYIGNDNNSDVYRLDEEMYSFKTLSLLPTNLESVISLLSFLHYPPFFMNSQS